MKIGVIGCGTIASAVVEGLAGQGHVIRVSSRSRKRAEALAQQFDEVTIADNQDVLDESDVIFLGLMAEHAADVLSELHFRPDHKVISLMAGADLQQVQNLVSPAGTSVIMIPFPNIARGNSPILTQGDNALILQLFAPRNQIYLVANTQEMQSCLAAQAVLSPALKLVNTAETWLDAACPGGAQGFLRHLVASNLEDDTGVTLQALDTPGGYNQRLRDHMEKSGMSKALTCGLDDLTR